MRPQPSLETAHGTAARPLRAPRIPASVRTLAERSTPTEIRLDIQKLMQQEQMELAQALGAAGLSLHPQSDEMMAINALLAISRGDWQDGRELMRQLMALQGPAAPATSFWLMARCERCMGLEDEARETLEQGLRVHPASAELQTELSLMLHQQA
jgi:hypothetical protein